MENEIKQSTSGRLIIRPFNEWKQMEKKNRAYQIKTKQEQFNQLKKEIAAMRFELKKLLIQKQCFVKRVSAANLSRTEYDRYVERQKEYADSQGLTPCVASEDVWRRGDI